MIFEYYHEHEFIINIIMSQLSKYYFINHKRQIIH